MPNLVNFVRSSLTYLTITASLTAVSFSPANAFSFNDLFRLATTNQCVFCDLTAFNFENVNLSDAILFGSDLSNANLSNTVLLNADLRFTNFSNATLRDAVLIGANLSNGTLKDSDLGDAILFEANLTDADVSDANLRDADLSNAILFRTNFSNANLNNANLNNAFAEEANFSDADLTDASLNNVNLLNAIINIEQMDSVVSLSGILPDGTDTNIPDDNLANTQVPEPTTTIGLSAIAMLGLTVKGSSRNQG